MTSGFCMRAASASQLLLLMVALISSTSVSAHREVISHKKLSKEVKTKVKQLRKVTTQIDKLTVPAGEAKEIRWDDICATNIPLKETSACQQLTPQVWFDPFYPNTNQFLAPQEDSQENSNDFATMCVENQGPCASVFKKSPQSQHLRTLLQMKSDQPCRQCIERSYGAAIHSMHTHIITSLADTVQTLHAFAAHTNSTASTNLATQRAERITQDIIPMLTTDRIANVYAYHVARMVLPQVLLTAPEEIAMVTACCRDAISLPSAITSWFTTAIAYAMVAVSVFGGLWAWQSSYQAAAKVSSRSVMEEPSQVSVKDPTVEKSRMTAAARSIQSAWKRAPTSPKATSREIVPCMVAQEPEVAASKSVTVSASAEPKVMETAPLAISWRRAAPLPTSRAPGKELLLNNIQEPTDSDSGLVSADDAVVTEKDSQDESQTDDSLPDLVPQQLSPRLIAEKKQSRGWMIMALVVLLIALGLGLYFPDMEGDGYGAPVPRTPPPVVKSWSQASNLGGSYGPILPYKSKS